MLPYQTLISLDRSLPTLLNQQITAAFIRLIQQGTLSAKDKLPGTRTLAELLTVNRQTVVVAFDELEVQGWIEQLPSKGAFVSSNIPEIIAQPLSDKVEMHAGHRAGFTFARMHAGISVTTRAYASLILDAGTPDARLAPLAALSRKYRTVYRRAPSRRLFGYTLPNNSLALRQQLAQYLHESRGILAREENIFITRGSTMAMYLVAQLVLSPGDTVVVGERSYPEADQLFQHQGARLQRVSVDNMGLVIDEVEALCRHQRIRLLYITPHHHYPTTVTLSAERRVRLLQLAEQYNFVIVEDDYDFDYHYTNSPILPLASADQSGRVLYVGSLSKTLAPSIRVGYVAGPADFVAEMGSLRMLIDHQGDNVLEQGIAELFAEGDMQAHLKRSRKIYQQRRDVFCHLLRSHLSEWFAFQEPLGGMAVWGQFCEAVDLAHLSAACHQAGLGIGDGLRYQTSSETKPSHLRLGFAALNPDELTQSVHILEKTLRTLYG